MTDTSSNTYTLHHGDCLDVLRGMADASVDSIVTDPPYGLSDHKPTEVVACLSAWIAGELYTPKGKGFMGKGWDAWVPGPEVWRECLRVLKPGGHLLAFAGTRSMDLMCMAVRLAGFELRDSIGYASDGGDTKQVPVMAWTFGSGFPKSMDVSKAIDKAAGVEREVVGEIPDRWTGYGNVLNFSTDRSQDTVQVLGGPATESAKQWQGWGTALKPAWEPIILARKPLAGTVAANVLDHGTGGLNIDGCRVATDEVVTATRNIALGSSASGVYGAATVPGVYEQKPGGRWPANLLHDGSPEVVALFPQTGKSTGGGQKNGDKFGGGYAPSGDDAIGYGDTGSAARFFYCAKASRKDRDEGLEGFDLVRTGGMQATADGSMLTGSGNERTTSHRNTHCTVKPTDLMRYLCRLVTPPGGVVLDPFAGSGSTGKAAVLEGFRFIGAEREAEYVAIARARIEAAAQP
jgi:hypothetical protein